MQGLRHQDLAVGQPKVRRLVAILLLAGLALMAGACRDDAHRQHMREAARYQRMFSASGRRVVVTAADGSVARKLRKRHQRVKVYDENLAALGHVRWYVQQPQPSDVRSNHAQEGGAQSNDAQTADARTVDAQDPSALAGSALAGNTQVEISRIVGTERWVSHDAQPSVVGRRAVTIPGYLRVENDQNRWVVFDDAGQQLATFERSKEGEWSMRPHAAAPTPDAATLHVTQDAPGGAKLLRESAPVAQLQVGQLAPVEMLAMQVPGLNPLAQVALGVWLHQNID